MSSSGAQSIKMRKLSAEIRRMNKSIADQGNAQTHLQNLRWLILPNPSDTTGMSLFDAYLLGAENTPYANQLYKLLIDFRNINYPTKPPKVCFVTQTPIDTGDNDEKTMYSYSVPCLPYHPNVYEDGSICLDSLQNQWTPSFQMRTIVLSILSLLETPNTASPANPEASNLYDADPQQFEATVLQKYGQNMM